MSKVQFGTKHISDYVTNMLSAMGKKIVKFNVIVIQHIIETQTNWTLHLMKVSNFKLLTKKLRKITKILPLK